MLTGGVTVKPVPVSFASTQEEESFWRYVSENIQALKNSFSERHNQILPEERRLYRGQPRDKEKSFPWRNASNIVVQIIGQAVDNLKARVITSLYEMSPLWPVSIIGKWDAQDQAEEQRSALEDLLTYCGLSKKELDFFRVEQDWLHDMIVHGAGVIKAPHVEDYEEVVLEGGSTTVPKYIGPRPERVLLDDFAATPESPTLEAANFKWHRIRLTLHQIEERMQNGVYDKKKLEKVRNCPDETTMDPKRLAEFQAKGIDIDRNELFSAKWHLYECWFPYYKGGKKYRVLATYHLASGTGLRAVYNFYPDNAEPFVGAKQGYSDGWFGRGFADLLKDYQEEVTVGHNQRVDKRTLANTSIIRINTGSRLDSNFRFYPGMAFPGDAGSIEVLQVGSAGDPQSIEGEVLSLKLAEDRCGVGPATSGMGGLGAGTVGKTTGAYSSMGTYSVMQDQNKNVLEKITNFREAHMRAGMLFASEYAHFGIGNRRFLFGEKRAEQIQMALEAIKSERLSFSVRAATASINREVEKQNYLLLSGVMQRHYTAIGQMLQGILNPQVPEEIRQYLMKTITGSEQLMAKIMRAFDIEDASRILPEALGGMNGNTGAGSIGTPTASPEPNTLEQSAGSEQEADAGMAFAASLLGSAGVPPQDSGA